MECYWGSCHSDITLETRYLSLPLRCPVPCQPREGAEVSSSNGTGGRASCSPQGIHGVFTGLD